MGFLDRLVTDMIQDSTGLPVRRLVRMVGGKNLLLMGAGAALAGGAVAALGQGSRPVGQGTTAPPPPPGAVPPPPPPPLPPASAAAFPGVPPPPPPATATPPSAPAVGEAEEPIPEVTYAVVRTMVAAALADGRLAPEEQQIIFRHLGESGLTEDHIRQIHRDLVLPPSPEELAALAPAAAGREALYRFAALIVLADRRTSDLERRWLDRLAAAFELAAERRAALEAEIFSPDDQNPGASE